MSILDKCIHIVAFILFLAEAGTLILTNAVPTTLSASVYCIAGAIWVVNSYYEKFCDKTE